MGQYVYDESGAIFNYFLLSILTILLLPSTLSLFSGGSTDGKKAVKGEGCGCAECVAKRRLVKEREAKKKSVVPVRLIFILLGWVLFGFVAYQVAITTLEEKGLWDPYNILDVSESATLPEIKKKFRELSLKFHPDKVAESEKEEASAKFVEISKAYKVLTDEEARKIWDETGHPDGKQPFSLGIALPKWLVDKDNNSLVLLVYAAIFGVGLPYWVAQWWYRAKNVSGSKIRHSTMARFYKDLKDQTPVKGFLELVCKSEEVLGSVQYSKSEIKVLEELGGLVAAELLKVNERFDAKKKFANLEAALTHKAQVLLYAHMLRIKVSDKKLRSEQVEVVEKAVAVVPGILQIAAARYWLTTAVSAIDLSQLITQATFAPFGPMSQLPHMSADVFKHFVTKKRQIRSIRELLELDDEDRKDLLRSISDSEFNDVITVASQYPILKVKKALFSVMGESSITPGSIVTLQVKIEMITPAALRADRGKPITLEMDQEPEERKAQWFDKKASTAFPAHCPYFPSPRDPTWWVMLGDKANNRLICLGKITDLPAPGQGDRSARLQFQAPPKPGTWSFQVFIKCDSVIGCDGLVEAKLVVEDAPPVEEIEDDISEPDEDSIAGQMQALRSGKVPGGEAPAEPTPKPKKGGEDDYEDSDDSD
ncbi:secretory subunit [Dinochytrium kinnereticum]|nr:secretory subunit [Dinochytrium kinnereticum]